jgi:hypothetical protein
MERTKVFAYKGVVGIQSGPECELIAHPGGGNLGCVADASKVDISQEAIDVLKTVKKNRDVIGDIGCFKADDGMVVFSWFGYYLRPIVPAECEADRDTDLSLLTASTELIEVPQEFKEFVDEMQLPA